MKKVFLSLMALLGVLSGAHLATAQNATPVYDKGINIIPLPQELVEKQETAFQLNKSTVLVAGGKDAKIVAEFLATTLRRSSGLPLKVRTGKVAKNTIYLTIDPKLNLKNEGYTLTSGKDQVVVTGKTAQGLFYGMQSLLQLLPAEIQSKTKVSQIAWNIPAVSIKDEPTFGYRGMLIDVCRHFLTVEDMKRQIDVLSMFKINRLHWHLTEDQAWRIEIKKYPKLTQIGSKRIEGDGSVYEGYYTQEQIKEVVKYAQDRFITIIPEIELPGHAMAAITAYPELACFDKDYRVRNIWGVERDVYCAGKETMFNFIKDVFDEIVPLFPSEYYHIGGDECPKDSWKKCPLCQKRIKNEGLKDEHELQSYVIRRAEKLLAAHGKKLIGWEEILEGGLAPSATVMSWIGEQSGIKSANMGHDVVMTPGSGGLYIDHYQGDSNVEPIAICCYAPLEKTYSYDPVPAAIDADKRHHILGAQGNLWAEYLYDVNQFEYMAYPRMLAVAELTWTAKDKKNFADFCRRLDNAYVRLDQVGVNYHIPLPEQPGGSYNHVAFLDTTSLTLKSTRPIKMVYTLDGSEPNANSAVYTSPIPVKSDMVIKVASVLPSGKVSTVRAIYFQKQTLAPAIRVADTKPGLKTKTLVGDFLSAKDFAGITTGWTDSVVTDTKAIFPDKMHNDIREVKRKAVVADGYIKISKSGVYRFSTNFENLSIDGKLLIDNASQVKKFSHNDAGVALEAGLHRIQITFVGEITGGFPSYWAEGVVWYQGPDTDNHRVEVKADLLSH